MHGACCCHPQNQPWRRRTASAAAASSLLSVIPGELPKTLFKVHTAAGARRGLHAPETAVPGASPGGCPTLHADVHRPDRHRDCPRSVPKLPLFDTHPLAVVGGGLWIAIDVIRAPGADCSAASATAPASSVLGKADDDGRCAPRCRQKRSVQCSGN